MKKKSNIEEREVQSRPLRNAKGDVLNDYETAKQAVKAIDEFEKNSPTPHNLNPLFVEWLRAGVKFVENGKGSFVDYKQKTIQKQLNYDIILANTEKRNAKMAKKGEFDAKIVRKIKGVRK